VVTFLTREYGLVTAVAKNARKSLKRFGGGLLSPGRAAWYVLRVNPRSEVGFVARGEDNPKFPTLPTAPVALALSSWAVELARSLEAPGNPATFTCNLLVRHLTRLAQGADFQPPALEARRISLSFTKCYLEIAGFGPTLTACRRCGLIPETGSWSWVPSLGAVYCPQCRQAHAPKIPGGLIAALGAIKDPLDTPNLNSEELFLAESFFAQMASLASDRIYKSRRVLLGLLTEQIKPSSAYILKSEPPVRPNNEANGQTLAFRDDPSPILGQSLDNIARSEKIERGDLGSP
jgi:DNA repair protein RecO (recombination protein O)